MDYKGHWDAVYRARPADQVSWFQPHAFLSLKLIRESLPDRQAQILDVGGGASTLAADLLEAGYGRIAVLDLAIAGFIQARLRVGAVATSISWIVGDILAAPFASGSVDLWHDRAVFHFLTDPVDRANYIAEVRRTLRPGGLALVATFAADGPERCSGLPVSRYSPEELHTTFDGGFELLSSHRELHRTPVGLVQPFTYCLCRYAPQGHTRAAA